VDLPAWRQQLSSSRGWPPSRTSTCHGSGSRPSLRISSTAGGRSLMAADLPEELATKTTKRHQEGLLGRGLRITPQHRLAAPVFLSLLFLLVPFRGFRGQLSFVLHRSSSGVDGGNCSFRRASRSSSTGVADSAAGPSGGRCPSSSQ